MNPDNLSKPVPASEFLDATDGICSPEKGASDTATLRTGGPTPPLLDVKEALERLEGDRELFEDLARLFADECPKTISEIHSALDSADFVRLGRLAHTLKGSSASMGAESVRQLALELEMCSRARDLPEAKKLFERLRDEMDRLAPELKAIFGAAAT